MAAAPEIKACAQDVWTKVATNVTAGMVYVMNTGPQYLQTWRTTGGAAPTDGNPDEGVGMNEDLEGNEISAPAAIDVYVYCVNAAGSVRVDV